MEFLEGFFQVCVCGNGGFECFTRCTFTEKRAKAFTLIKFLKFLKFLKKFKHFLYAETCSSVLFIFRNVQHVRQSVAIVWPASVKKGFWEKVEASRILHSNDIAWTVPTRSHAIHFLWAASCHLICRWFLAMLISDWAFAFVNITGLTLGLP